MCLKSPKETEQGLKNCPVVITKYTTDSKRALRNVSFCPHKVCTLLRATAEPKQNQLLRRGLDTDVWKMATRLQYHICHSLSCQPRETQHREVNSGHRLLRIYGG